MQPNGQLRWASTGEPVKGGFLVKDKDELQRILQASKDRDAERAAEAQANAWTMLALGAAAFVALLTLIWVLRQQPKGGAK